MESSASRYVFFCNRSVQNVHPNGGNSGAMSRDQLMPICELGELSNMRPLGSILLDDIFDFIEDEFETTQSE